IAGVDGREAVIGDHVIPTLVHILSHEYQYSRRADWLNLLGAKGGGGGRLQAPTASPSLPGSPKGAAMAMVIMSPL
ncbi:Importin subunit alpha-2, partial [Dissostichus eleginoides]